MRTEIWKRADLHRKVAASLERDREQGLNVGTAELASHLDLDREPMAALGYYAQAAESALLHSVVQSSTRSVSGSCVELSRRAQVRWQRLTDTSDHL